MLALDTEIGLLRTVSGEFQSFAGALLAWTARLERVADMARYRNDQAAERAMRELVQTGTAHAATWSAYARQCTQVADAWAAEMAAAESGAGRTAVPTTEDRRAQVA